MPGRTYTITLTLTVSDADNDGVWVVTDDRSTEYGAGDTPTRAVADYLQLFSDEMYSAHYMDDLGPIADSARAQYERLRVWAGGERHERHG